jgi:plastocyanin
MKGKEGRTMRSFIRTVSGIAALGAVVAGTVGARAPHAAVSGQVTILERPGDESEDLGNVVVYLEPAGNTRVRVTTPTDTVMTLRRRQFEPRVRVITVGSRVKFPNDDPFNHNVFSKANGGFDTQVYGRGKTRDNLFAVPGVYPLYCNVHPRMTAFVITLNTPYFTQANIDGSFRFDDVPPGQYKLHAWHDRAPEVIQDITVGTAGLARQRVELDARGYKFVQHKNKFGQDYTSASGDRY